MSRVYILVEGQTEEAFVNELLVPHYSNIGLYLTPIIVSTSPGHKGGVSSYAKIRPQIERLCKQGDAHVTTLFDLYALPKDFPGRENPNYPHHGRGADKAVFIESFVNNDIGKANFSANIVAHEFEALLFSQLDAFREWTDDDDVLEPLIKARQNASPEDINDGVETAPSKRILRVMKSYQKPVHGPLIACSIGLDTIRQECPHFHCWLARMERLI
ncbi:DUF4276 family protein [Rhizobium skierniewicense]|uniref:DUF4276 family protein n=1 Tax=Rhizobium TaxID=379 RepID=UPI001FACC955|nr:MULTISPECIES: DUF4276 family protein [Rhizobium]MCI9866048.1 DUF4276 family protein [Rhizobium skierniewicense]